MLHILDSLFGDDKLFYSFSIKHLVAWHQKSYLIPSTTNSSSCQLGQSVVNS